MLLGFGEVVVSVVVRVHRRGNTVSDESGSIPQAGWFADPLDSSRQRWWNGSGWTDRVHPEEASGFSLTIAEASPPRPGADQVTKPIVPAMPVIVIKQGPAASPRTVEHSGTKPQAGEPHSPGHSALGPNPLLAEPGPPLTRRELRKRVGRLTSDHERWRPSTARADTGETA